MLSFDHFSEFLQRKKTQLQQVEEQTEVLQKNIMENKCELWLDSILTRILLAYGLLDREFVSFRIERHDKKLLRASDYINIVHITNRAIQEYGSCLGLSYGADFPSTVEQADILCYAFYSWRKVEVMFQAKGYLVEVKVYGNGDRDLVIHLQ